MSGSDIYYLGVRDIIQYLRIRILRFFQISKKHDILRFLEWLT